jgi:hypothetical protein
MTGPQILDLISISKPTDLVQLYTKLTTELPKKDVDMIFVNHGAFADIINRNLKQDSLEEQIGYTGDPRPSRILRSNVPEIPGSYISSESDATFNVSLIHDPPYGNYDYSYTVNMTGGDLTYFQMPPEYYPSKAVFSQVTADGNRTLASKVLVIDSDDYWNYIEAGGNNNTAFKTVPVPVAVHSLPVDRLSNLNKTGLDRDNGTYYEINNLRFGTQRSNLSASLNENNLSPIPEIDNSQVTNENSTLTPSVLLPSTNESLTHGMSSFNSNANATYVTVEMLPNSSPLFYKCNETTVNGSSMPHSLNGSAGIIQALTDGNPSTHISGNVTFDIMFEKPLRDMAGPDLIINESGTDMEFYNVEIISKDSASLGPKMFVSNPTPSVDACGGQINTFQIDFEGLPHEGDTISGIRINNDPDKNGGADISDITTVNFGPLLTRQLSGFQQLK